VMWYFLSLSSIKRIIQKESTLNS